MEKKSKPTSKLGVILAYEFKKMTMNKAFVIVTLLGPLLMAAVSILPSLIAMKTMDRSHDKLRIGVFAPDARSRANAELSLLPAFVKRGWTATLSSDEAALRASTLGKALDGYVALPATFPLEDPAQGVRWYAKGSTDVSVSSLVSDAVSSVMVSARLALANVDEVYARSLVRPVPVTTFKLSATDSGADRTDAGDFIGMMATALAFCLMIYMTVLLYGQQIGRSVVAEKSSKIVDVLLSSVRTEDLLFGKLLGIGLAGLVQYAVWISFGSVALGVFGQSGLAAASAIPDNLGPDKVALLVLFFLGGYLLYSSVYAACGAASEDDQHMAQLAMPLLIVLMIPMLMLQVFIQRPDSLLTVALSYVPFTAPMVMLIRALVSPVPLYEIALSLSLLALTVALTIRIAAKVFRVGIVMTGRNFTFRDVAAWIRA